MGKTMVHANACLLLGPTFKSSGAELRRQQNADGGWLLYKLGPWTWSKRSGPSGPPGKPIGQGIDSVAFSPDGSRLAAGGSGKEALKLYDTAGYQELLTLEADASGYPNSPLTAMPSA
jgi:hypothetical protein